jgi:hypothetical protein
MEGHLGVMLCYYGFCINICGRGICGGRGRRGVSPRKARKTGSKQLFFVIVVRTRLGWKLRMSRKNKE